MKDLSMIHYLLGQEVLHKTDETFPKSRKTYNENIKEVQYERMQNHHDGFEENE
jgi:hypothetical protein